MPSPGRRRWVEVVEVDVVVVEAEVEVELRGRMCVCSCVCACVWCVWGVCPRMSRVRALQRTAL